MNTIEERPNIRIEIHNNLVDESMDVDENSEENAFEEGEISDNNEEKIVSTNNQFSRRIWPNQTGGFTTGINIFNKEEQEKLQGRARRFGLQPTEINNFTDEQLQELHDSLGITTDDEKDVRFDAIHMRGTDEMSTEDVLEYFGKFGPSGVEWINDESCNIIWNDKISAARALFFLSSAIEGMPVEGSCDPFSKEFTSEDLVADAENSGRSVLLRNNDREVELEKEEFDDKIQLSDITIPIPPGYWRLGTKHGKAKFILLRFALKSDKKPLKAERFSEYYKKYGNPNFGGMKGIITQSHRQKTKGIFDHNRDMKNNKEVVDSKNPWGVLAENWEEEEEVKSQRIITHQEPVKPKQTSTILNRLGFKRSLSENKEDENEEKSEKKTKIPRMRMYADEEEEKIKRKRQLDAIKKHRQPADHEKSMDLRDILRIPKTEKSLESKERSHRNQRKYDDKNIKSKFRSDEEIPKRQVKSRMDTSQRPRHRRSPELENDYQQQNVRKKYNLYSEEYHDSSKPKSKVAVVINAPKRPAVASTVWSRINNESDRLKTISEGKLRVRRNSSSDSESSSSTSGKVSSDSESNDETNVKIERPGFRNNYSVELNVVKKEHKSPLRIEINNDHFKN